MIQQLTVRWQGIEQLTTNKVVNCRVSVVDHQMTLGESYKAYQAWRSGITEGEASSILVTTYQAACKGWDFSMAGVCIFVQQPWLAQYKVHALGQFFVVNEKRDTKVHVFDLGDMHIINRIVSGFGSGGAKIRLGLVRSCAQALQEVEEWGTAYDFEKERLKDVQARAKD